LSKTNETSHNANINDLNAVVDGDIVPIEDVDDRIFSKKLIGDGYAIIPSGDTIFSPIDAKVEQVAPTNHAIYLSITSGVKLLIHIGIDTVELKGKGFESNLEKGKQVKADDPLIKFDPEFIKNEGLNPIVTVVLLNGSEKDIDLTVFPQTEAKANQTIAMRLNIT